MAARGMMKVGGDGKPQMKTTLPDLGKLRIYIVTSKIFEEVADA